MRVPVPVLALFQRGARWQQRKRTAPRGGQHHLGYHNIGHYRLFLLKDSQRKVQDGGHSGLFVM